MTQAFTERYFRTKINLTYDLLLKFLKFRKKCFQGTRGAGYEGVNLVLN